LLEDVSEKEDAVCGKHIEKRKISEHKK